MNRWNISTIVVPIDLSSSRTAFDSSLRVARLFGAGRIHLVHVIPDVHRWMRDMPSYSGGAVQEALATIETSAKKRLAEFTAPPDARCEVTYEARFGAPAREIVLAADACRADLLVLASGRHSAVGRLVFGSVAHTVVRAAGCPVLVVREGSPWIRPRRVLAAVDLSPISEQVVARAIDVARAAQAEVDVFSAYDPAWGPAASPEATPLWLDDTQRAAHADAHGAAVGSLIDRSKDPEVRISMTIEDARPPAEFILERAKECGADLIVLGSSGHSAWQRFYLGSTTTRVLAKAEGPVLVLPARHG